MTDNLTSNGQSRNPIAHNAAGALRSGDGQNLDTQIDRQNNRLCQIPSADKPRRARTRAHRGARPKTQYKEPSAQQELPPRPPRRLKGERA